MKLDNFASVLKFKIFINLTNKVQSTKTQYGHHIISRFSGPTAHSYGELVFIVK